MIQHMTKRGNLWNCGNVATYVPELSRRIIQVVKGGQHFLSLMSDYGLYAADSATVAVGKQLDAMCPGLRRNTIRLLSYYDSQNHVLYANEYAGNFLRITSNKVERLRCGDDGMLFDWGEQKCDPLECQFPLTQNKALAPEAGPLAPDGKAGLLRYHILNTVNYSEDGIGQNAALLLLTCSLLALYFPERLNRAIPFPTFSGAGGSMKSALAKKVGKLIQGRNFEVIHAPEGPGAVQEIKNNAINYPFMVLDEANKLRGLSNILKVIATGGKDTRRVLYTTSTMQEKEYQSRLWLTMNTGDPNEETVASRMLIIDVALRQESDPYRATFYLEWTKELRDQLWTELVGRLACAMRELEQADEDGQGDLPISHRMADFLVFGLTLAKQEGSEAEFRHALSSLSSRQETAVNDSIEIVDLLEKVPQTLYGGKELSAKDWGRVLLLLVGYEDHELRRKLASKNVVAWWFKSNENLLTSRYGMRVRRDTHLKVTLYSFERLGVHANTMPFTDSFNLEFRQKVVN